MLNEKKKFFTKKAITLIVASVIILGALIVLTATDTIHTISKCKFCEGTGVISTGNDKKTCGVCNGKGSGMGSIWALVPPIIAIGLALITKEVFSSLFIGILSGAILLANFEPLNTVDGIINTGLISAVSDTAGIFVFLIELGILVCLINKAGGSKAFGEWAEAHVKTRTGACLCTFVLGILMFIDDYFNCLTVGSVMRPVTDKHKISRSKLAYLIHSTSAPICMITPISSWAAAVSQCVADGQGFSLFVVAIPMNFYSILTLVFVLGITLMKFDFGPMRQHEINAQHGDLFSGKQVKQDSEIPCSNGRVFDLIIPIVILLITCIFALLYVGGFFGTDWWGETTFKGDFIGAFGNTDATISLPWGGLITLIATIIYMAIRKVVTFKESMEALPKGFIAMVPAIFILTFATALKNMTSELGASFYVGNLVSGTTSSLMSLLPAIIFLVACILAFATGTSWGTFGILIPIVTAMFPKAGDPLLIVGMSACLAGAVCGDHCSPISDTTIMSSAGAKCEHLNHVSTQLPYAIYVAVISLVCFIIAGFVPYWYVMLPLSIVIMVASLFIVKHFVKKSATTEKDVKDTPIK